MHRSGSGSHLVDELAVHGLAVLVDQLEGVAPVAVHVAIAIRDATVTEQKGDLGMRGGQVGGVRGGAGGREKVLV